MQFVMGASLAIAFGVWFILAPRSVIWFYGDFLGGRMEKATSRGIQVTGVVIICLILAAAALIQFKIIGWSPSIEHQLSNQTLQPTATRCAFPFFMIKTVLEIFSPAPGSRG
jgi:hypothetical protein